jgi:hypothetical protein
MRGSRRVLALVACAAALGAAAPTGAVAQTTRLSVTTTPAFPTPTAADFAAGAVQATTGLAYVVTWVNGAASTQRTATVTVRALAPLMSGGTKPVSDLQWRRADQPATWTSLSTLDQTVESRPMQKNAKLNETWGNALQLRLLLSWTADTPGTHGANVYLALTVTSP